MTFVMPETPWQPATRFVWDRIRATSYTDREYIAALLHAERLLDGHPVRGFAANVALRTLLDIYPAECNCIKRELREGAYTPPSEFRRLKDEAEAKLRREAEAIKLARQEEEMDDYRWWLDQGGGES